MVSEQNDTRKQMGSKGAVVYRNAKNPDEVFLIFEWEDEKSFMDYFKLTEVQKALEETGTTEIIEISESFKLEA
jgi:heme-degrading monooxygenase HmoA